MAKDVVMPALGMAQDTGRILRWIAAEGSEVRRGDALLEIETDKVTVEIEAPVDGVLSAVSAGEGEDVPVGQVIARILAPGEEPGETDGAPTVEPEATTTEKPQAATTEEPDGGAVAAAKGPSPARPRRPGGSPPRPAWTSRRCRGPVRAARSSPTTSPRSPASQPGTAPPPLPPRRRRSRSRPRGR